MKQQKLSLILGGYFVGVAGFAQPYDYTNIAILIGGLLMVASAWLSISKRC